MLHGRISFRMLVNRRFAVGNPLIPVDFSVGRQLASVDQVRQVAAALTPWTSHVVGVRVSGTRSLRAPRRVRG